ncbi:alpha/beta hydrolase fold domain-containing protein [Rivibacter subsaxonicus]|uniref:Acetyl esterase/lipase n=1 Tax=Rivibacter subsaxonicus TaxID=457575 RepID=A0A4Q7VNQ6_9BURK|nr:alpha/beta hydrolase fold domain-containing protein [Rivibacter subsaxonicus]RZT98003.1 acetyl esterase/lipase [Rivibacter subsaxonicus]
MSLTASVINFYLRRKVKRKPGQALVVAEIRADMRKLSARHRPKLPKGVSCTPYAADPATGAPGGEVLSVAEPGFTLLYLRGGGYFFCDLDSHRPVCALLAHLCRTRVVAVDYRLAPEHPFPAALDDALAAYRALLAEGTPAHRIAIAGDSAGGGLALACLLAARDAGLPLPAAALLFSPWTDLACTGSTLRTNTESDVMFRGEQLAEATAFYLNGHDPLDPLVSPLYGDLRGLPRLQVHASQHEVLLADSTRLVDAARRHGVWAELLLRPRLPHVWPIFVMLPEAMASLKQGRDFLLQALADAQAAVTAASVEPSATELPVDSPPSMPELVAADLAGAAEALATIAVAEAGEAAPAEPSPEARQP